ncbi:MAG: hypothetical protein LAN84_01865 [Acidobacteriia bacterium]|nr:hypothetical protein [Terriglobia bacterium]
MRPISVFRAVILLAAAALVGIPACAQQEQQVSVAEAARRARAQKKAPQKPVKVLTEDELAGSTPANTAAPAGTPEEAAGDKTAAKKTAEEGAGPGAKSENKDEKFWRARFKQARENLARAEKELDVLQRESSKAQIQNYSDPNKAMQEQLTRKEINEKQAQIEAKKKEIADLRDFISKLEDELRMSGGDTGWAR